tara:strand:- start:54 stop:1049 length:996 start_codon:yes stop_codon:yes gene_type:complete
MAIHNFNKPSISVPKFDKDKIAKIKADRDKLKQERSDKKLARKKSKEDADDQVNNIKNSALKAEGISKLQPVIAALVTKLITIVRPQVEDYAKTYILSYLDQCPPQQISEEMLFKVNNTIEDLNKVVSNLSKIGNVLNITTKSVLTLQGIANGLNIAIPAISAAAKSTPLIPGFVVSALDDLDYFNNKILYAKDGTPRLPKLSGGIAGSALMISIFSNILVPIVAILEALSTKLQQCLPNEQVSKLSEDVIQYTKIGDSNDYESQDPISYNGFVIRIEEVPYTPTVNQKRAVGYNTQGVPLIKTELSFTTNNLILITELKTIIDENNLKAY